MITLAPPSTRSVTAPNCDDAALAISSLIASQRELVDAIRQLTDEQYCRKQVGGVASSIGGHVRHCLDHIIALIDGADSRRINYDRRHRGTNIETSRLAAIEKIQHLELKLINLDTRADDDFCLTTLISPNLPPIEVTTSFGRELAFVLSHTIHHCSLIAIVLKAFEVPVAEQFGYAPATLAFLEQRRCAQ